MKNVLKSTGLSPVERISLARNTPRFPATQKKLAVLTWILIALACFGGLLLLLEDALLLLFPQVPHAPISAAPLLLIGVASLGFQRLLRPRPLDFFKALLVSLAFLLWGVDQLLPLGWGATSLGDLVIVLYVVDLGWMMAGGLHARQHGRSWQEQEGEHTPQGPDRQAVSASTTD